MQTRGCHPRGLESQKMCKMVTRGGSSSTLGNFSAPPNSVVRGVHMSALIENMEERNDDGKNQKENEENFSEEESEEIDNELLIDTNAAENREKQMGGVSRNHII